MMRGALLLSCLLALPAYADPPLAIDGGAGDLLLLVANASNPPVDLLRALRAEDGVPVALAGNLPTQCAAAKSAAMHPNGRFVYVAADTEPAGTVCAYELDPVTRTLFPAPGSPYPAGRGTRSIVVDPSGAFVYAANFTDGSITGYSVDDRTGALGVHNASPYVSTDQGTGRLAVDPLGRFLYATNTAANGTVSGFAINRDNGQLTHVPFSPLPTVPMPGAVAVDPRGRFAYVGAEPNQIYAIDAQSGQLVATNATFAPRAHALAFDPAGRYLYTVSGSGAQSLVNAYRVEASGIPAFIGSLPTGADPAGIAVARNGRYLYTANAGAGNVSGFRIDRATGALTAIAGSPFPGVAGMQGVVTFGALAATDTWQIGEAIARPFGVSGGRLPYAWAISAGALPPGIALEADLGLLTGTPTALGTYAFTARVTEAFGGTVSRNFSLTVKSDVSLPAFATVVEFYNAALDHYFITWLAAEIAALDAGNTPTRWTRTGRTFNVYISAQPGSSPICRYYIPPNLGDSHFFGRGSGECAATGAANPSFVLEDPAFMHMILPAAGACPAATVPVYRVFSNRADANHRYLTDRALRDEMVARGWLAEGDGPDLVVMCAPA